MRGKVLVLSCTVLFLCGGPVFAAEIDSNELKAAQGRIDFENNKNLPPSTAWNSLDEIRAIGAKLGAALLEQKGKPYIVVGDKKRYLLKEVVPEKLKAPALSADILELGAQAGVDSIRNLRLILAGYLEAAYAFSKTDAEELAMYITVYNALNREKMDRFVQNYSKQVVSQLKKNRVGLARSYKEWPSRTQIVVPLFADNVEEEPEVEIKAVLDKEVIEAVEKERPGITSNPESLVVKEKNAARHALDEAEKKQNSLGGALKKTLEKENDLGARVAKLREETEAMKGELIKAQKDVVKNKFGQPIQGNEAAKKLEEDLKKRVELLGKLETELQQTKKSARELEDQAEEAEADLNKKRADVERMGA